MKFATPAVGDRKGTTPVQHVVSSHQRGDFITVTITRCGIMLEDAALHTSLVSRLCPHVRCRAALDTF